MNRIKILFFVTEFWQAGGQRYTYEIDKALDKGNFEVSFLSYRGLNTHESWEDYYYQKHLALGSKIYFYQDFDKRNSLLHPSKRNSIARKKSFKKLNSFFLSFDTILIQGEWVFSKFQNVFNKTNLEKVKISLLNSISQHPDNFKKFDKTQSYQFISAFDEEAIKFELQEFTNYKHEYFPLAINIEDSLPSWDWSFTKKKRIGIFTRLTRTKPIDPFIYAFQLLLNRDSEFELYIYGNGLPEECGIMDHIRFLQLEDRIKFKGHQTNILDSAIQDEIGLAWFLGFHGMPAGFAGYDICRIGLPQLFWDLKPKSDYKSDVIPMFTNIETLANYSIDLFYNKGKLIELSNKQNTYLRNHRDIKLFIKDFEEFLTN